MGGPGSGRRKSVSVSAPPERRSAGLSSVVKARRGVFCEWYVQTGNALEAYKRAGYAGADGRTAAERAYRLLDQVSVRREIRRLEVRRSEDIRYSIDWLRQQHLRKSEECFAEGDRTNGTRNLELFGKTLGAYSERMTFALESQKEVSEFQMAEARRLAELAVQEHMDSGLPMLEGKVADTEIADGNGRS